MQFNDEVTQTSSKGGIGFIGLLTLIFVIAKITGYLTWSWWWIFSPLWIFTGVAFGLILLVLIIVGIAGLLGYSK